MKILLYSSTVALIMPILHLLLISISDAQEKYVKYLYVAGMAAFLVWGGLSYYLFSFVEVVSGFCLILFWFLSYAEIFSMLCRGFSLTILVDLFKKPNMTLDEVMKNYGGGRGVDWLFDKRISSLVSGKILTKEQENLKILSKGIFIGQMGLFYKSILNIGKGG